MKGPRGSFLLPGLVRKSALASGTSDSGESGLAKADEMLGHLDAETGGF